MHAPLVADHAGGVLVEFIEQVALICGHHIAVIIKQWGCWLSSQWPTAKLIIVMIGRGLARKLSEFAAQMHGAHHQLIKTVGVLQAIAIVAGGDAVNRMKGGKQLEDCLKMSL